MTTATFLAERFAVHGQNLRRCSFHQKEDMAKGINNVMLLGNVGRDPEIKATNGGTVVASFSMATPDRVKENGNWVDRSEWHNVVCFGRTAEIIRDYVRKGSKLLIEGKLQTRSWDDKQTQKKVYRTEVIGFDLTLRDSKQQGSRSVPRDEMGSGEEYPYQADDQDIPF
jgi:single-strand DNA-binding protein